MAPFRPPGIFRASAKPGLDRRAWEEGARVGAIPEPSTTKRTNVLVIGEVNPASPRPGAELTAEAAKAFALQEKGQDTEVRRQRERRPGNHRLATR